MSSGSRPHSPVDPSRALAELSVMTDALERLRDQAAAVAEPFLGTEREDIVAAVHEAERQILIAVRTMQRAMKALER